MIGLRPTLAASTGLSSPVPLGENRTGWHLLPAFDPELTVDGIQNCACHRMIAGVALRTLEPSDAATLWEPPITGDAMSLDA